MFKKLWLRPMVVAFGCVLAVACNDDENDDDDNDDDVPVECYDASAAAYVIGGANPLGVAGGTVEYAKEATPVAQFEINRSCGVLGADGSLGVPVQIQEVDPATDTTQARTVTQQLVDAGVRAMTGIGSNPTTLAASPVAIAGNVLMGSYIGFDAGLSGCTAAERANDAIVKSDTPVVPNGSTCWNTKGLFFRLSHSTTKWGRMAVAQAFDDNPTMSRAAVMNSNNGTGNQFRASFVGKLNEKGIASVPTANLTNNPTEDEIKGVLQTLTANNPEAIFVFIPQVNVRQMAEAYADLKADDSWEGKPAGFNAIRFYVAPPTYGTDYSNVTAPALAFLSSEQMTSVGVNFDLAFEGTARYAQVLADYSPTATIASVQTLRNYDLYLLFSLAISKVGADAPAADIAAAVRDIANGPGEVVYPDEYEKAKKLILAGTDVDYEGASGPVEFDDRNDAVGLTYNLANIQANGQAVWTTAPIIDD